MGYPAHLQRLRDELGLACPVSFGPGWTDLVRRSVLAIRQADPGARIAWIEAKYGSLRIELLEATAEAEELALAAETESEGICEVCGRPGRLRDDRTWISTLCDEHARRP